MKDESQTLTYKGKDYKLVFNLNVMEAIQEEYGSIDKWGQLTGSEGEEPNAKAVIFGFTQMLNEGIDISNEENGTEEKPLTLKQVGRLLTDFGMDKAGEKLASAVSKSTKTGNETKNA